LTAQKFQIPGIPGYHRSYRSYKSYITYKTGELARWLPDGNIEFLGRVDNQIKIRGFRIELGEIENRLLKLDEIKSSAVIAKEDKNGDKYLCAYIVSGKKCKPSEIKESLARELPDYMIPLYFTRLEKMPLTPSGKIHRKALPEPEIEAADRYIAPSTPVEKKLAQLWALVLGIKEDKISIDTSFFQLGGHSLKAAILVSKIHKVFHVKVPMAQIFKTPFIKELSRYISHQAPEDRYTSIKPVEEREYYALSSTQKRLFILQRLTTASTAYNIPVVGVLEGNIHKENLKTAFQRLISRHESLRTSFVEVNGEPVQRVHPAVDFVIKYYDLYRTRVEVKVKNFIRPFALAQAPLLRVGLIKREEKKYTLMIDMHHIITDGTSQGILKQEFISLYTNEELPGLRLRYKDFSEWCFTNHRQAAIKSGILKADVFFFQSARNTPTL
jgi:acyl carrier protein